MNIPLTPHQYRTLIRTIHVSLCIYGSLADTVDTKYKPVYQRIEQFEHELLAYADAFGFEHNVETYTDTPLVKEKYFNSIMDDVRAYDEQQLFESIAHKLAWRDFREDHTKEEIAKLVEKHGEYLGVPLYQYEEKYWDEINDYGYTRLRIQKS